MVEDVKFLLDLLTFYTAKSSPTLKTEVKSDYGIGSFQNSTICGPSRVPRN